VLTTHGGGLCSRGHAFLAESSCYRAQDYDYSHKDPRPSACTEVTAVAHPIEGDGLEHNQQVTPNTGDCLPLY
jgi:hypothetical protein